jgi:hypothetical protein
MDECSNLRGISQSICFFTVLCLSVEPTGDSLRSRAIRVSTSSTSSSIVASAFCFSCWEPPLADALRLCPLFAGIPFTACGEKAALFDADKGGVGEGKDIFGEEERRGRDGVRAREVERRGWSCARPSEKASFAGSVMPGLTKARRVYAVVVQRYSQQRVMLCLATLAHSPSLIRLKS